MPYSVVDGLKLYYELEGDGPPLVLVHGSWDDHRSWDYLLPNLVPRFRVLRYDRRGHGASECPPGQGRISEDVADLAGLIERLDLAPAHIVGHSYGATVTLLLALEHPQLCRTVTIHEPPVLNLLAGTEAAGLFAEARRRMQRVVDLLIDGQTEQATRMFVDEVGFGPGTWQNTLTPTMRQTFLTHADTWLDQARDPDRLNLHTDQHAVVSTRVLITAGDRSLPWFPPTMRRLTEIISTAELHTIKGCAHAPHLTHPAEFASLIIEHATNAEPRMRFP